ncbi:acyl carrier protein [Pseudoxanthomonas sp. UTMC 1351]|uniref:acyl carrier protein n=1 Tax=Pseudoxanthomonas sp. UTMC 1351 TaxID=2695853 RepID=UPI0034CDCF98
MKRFDDAASCEWLCAMISQQMGLPNDQVHPHMRLVSDLGIDSLELQSLLLAIEDALGVIPEGAQMQRITTVSDLHMSVLQLLEAKCA